MRVTRSMGFVDWKEPFARVGERGCILDAAVGTQILEVGGQGGDLMMMIVIRGQSFLACIEVRLDD